MAHIGQGQFEQLKRGEFIIVKEIFNGDSVLYKEINSWIRDNPFRSRKIRGYTRPVNVCTFKELYDKLQYMWSMCPREGTRRYKLLLQMEEYYNANKPKNLEAL